MAGAKRRLAAILAADLVGFGRLVRIDEEGTIAALKDCRGVFRAASDVHHGRIVDTAGDSVLAVFDSVVEAVRCAIEVQNRLAQYNTDRPEDRRMLYRIGVNLGDIIEEADGGVYGDGVIVASRLESVADAGGIIISGSAHIHLENRPDVELSDAGTHEVKNIAKPIRAYRVVLDGARPALPVSGAVRRTRVLAASVAALMIVTAASVGLWFGVVFDGSPESDPTAKKNEDPGAILPAFPEKASVAVLPFDNLSGDPGQNYFADGLTEEIIGTLARFPDIRVTARNSTFPDNGQAVDVRAVGEELSVEYLVEGSVRRGGDTIRVAAQLVETDTGAHLWSETYERQLSVQSVLDIQDDIAGRIANKLAGLHGVIPDIDLATVRGKLPSDLRTYDCLMLFQQYMRTIALEDFRVARDCLEQAVTTETDQPRVWRGLAGVYLSEFLLGFDPQPDPLERALAAARKAVALAPTEPDPRWSLAQIHFFRGELLAFSAEIDRVVTNPATLPETLARAGVWICYAGDWDKGMSAVHEALRRDPSLSTPQFAPFFDHYRKQNYDAALASAQKIDQPDYVWALAMKTAALGQLDRADEATPYIRRIRELRPDFEATARADRSKWFRYQEELLDHFMEGLRKAGLNVEVSGR